MESKKQLTPARVRSGLFRDFHSDRAGEFLRKRLGFRCGIALYYEMPDAIRADLKCLHSITSLHVDLQFDYRWMR